MNVEIEPQRLSDFDAVDGEKIRAAVIELKQDLLDRRTIALARVAR